MRIIRKFLLLSALAWVAQARAVDGVSLEGGHGDQGSHLGRGALEWNWGTKHPVGRELQWSGYWELSAGAWRNGESVTDLAVTPVFRLERWSGELAPFVEGAIGLHLLSEVDLSEHRTTGTRFMFGDHVGAGVLFGSRLRHEFGFRLQHLSNGGVASPNPGMNFSLLRYQYHFE